MRATKPAMNTRKTATELRERELRMTMLPDQNMLPDQKTLITVVGDVVQGEKLVCVTLKPVRAEHDGNANASVEILLTAREAWQLRDDLADALIGLYTERLTL